MAAGGGELRRGAACHLHWPRSESCQKECEVTPCPGENISKGDMADLESGEFSVQGQEKERGLLCQAEAPKPQGHYRGQCRHLQMIQCCNEGTAAAATLSSW